MILIGHSGGTDASGCHNGPEGYHCHNGGSGGEGGLISDPLVALGLCLAVAIMLIAYFIWRPKP